MPAPLSTDLRSRVIAAWQNHYFSRDDLAQTFQIGRATVTRWIDRFRLTGSVAPLSHGGGQPALISDATVGIIRTLVEEQPDSTLPELQADYQACTDQQVSPATISRALRRLNLTRKKKTLRATERSRHDVIERYEQFVQDIQQVDPARLKFIDEAGSTIAMTRTQGRAPSGERVYDSVPRNRGRVTTMLGLISLSGMEGLMTVEGGTTKKVFGQFVDQCVGPLLQRGDVVVMDNLMAHKGDEVRQAIEKTGAHVMFLPPYSPELNPIELAWSKLKSILRTLAARTREELEAAIAYAADCISQGDAVGWFLHCGYGAQPN
jgi:transposase